MDFTTALLSALRADERVILATIIATTGSTPVPAGAHMLLTGTGLIPLGTVGGGCVEAEIIEWARGLTPHGRGSLVRTFSLSEESIESGMLCGGTIDILLEPLGPEHLSLFQRLADRRASGEDTLVVTLLDVSGHVSRKVLVPVTSEPGHAPGVDNSPLLQEGLRSLPDACRDALRQQTVIRRSIDARVIVVEPFAGAQQVILFGGGHVSRFVSRCAALAGFEVTVVDDRPEYANPERFPEATRTLALPFDHAWDHLDIRSSASIVIVTRGHKFDERVLERAIRTPARYVGMIGSKRKVISAFTALLTRGVPAELLHAVHAPIGLDIGAVTAEEIGISIVAELVAVRRALVTPSHPMRSSVEGFFSSRPGHS